jgi:Tfp pilus assembly protein FimT
MRIGSRSAFTLIELTLVTVIILALVGLSIPLIKTSSLNLATKDTVLTISKLVSYAQERAVIDRKNYKVVFAFNSRQYQLFESNASVDGIAYKPAQGRFGKVLTLPRGLFFRDPKSGQAQPTAEVKKQPVFYPDGRSDAMQIEVVNRSGAGYSITSNGFGAAVRIKEVTGEE